MDELEDLLNKTVDKVRELIRNSNGKFAGQLESYTLGTLKAFIDDENQCGSVKILRNMLDDKEEE